MPFIDPDKTARNALSSANSQAPFIGRVHECDFFIQGILVPEKPVCNVLSITGNGGVGKTTLLARYIDQAHASEFKSYCTVAQVNERQADPARIMEHLAGQLRLTGDFEKALTVYKETVRKQRDEDEAKREATLRKVTVEVASEVVKTVPVVGPVLEKVTGPTIERIFDGFHEHQLLKDAERLEDPLGDLTRAFVKELNILANTQVQIETARIKRRRRIILFFDTFEKLALEEAPWLLDYFLEAEISTNIVLVIAGRDPLERSSPHDPKRWLPYHDRGAIQSIVLESFTFNETRAYLIAKGITDPHHIESIYQLSQGLPLYLGLLTANREGEVDPTKGVVDNFLRWISDQEQVKRSLSLDAALLSKAFNQDDLTVFTYIPEQEREALYLWLADQPFIRHDTHNGQCRYHELVQDMFSRYLFQRSPGAYRATRKAIADHYQVTLDQMKAESGEDIYVTVTWLELVLGLIYQLFLLPDESSLVTAVKWVLEVYEQSEQLGNVIWVLSELAEEQRAPQMSSTTQQTIRDLLKYFSFHWKSQAFIGATGSLLEKFAQHPSFPPTLAARIYRSRGKAYREQGEYQQAIDDFTQAITRDAKYSWAYTSRGTAYRLLNEYQEAIDDFTQAIALDPEYNWAYASRGTAHRLLNEYQEAIDDFTQAITLKPNYAWTYALRGETYFGAKQYKKAVNDFDHAIGLEPQAVEVYCLRGIAHMNLKEYKRAIDDFDYALQLDPSSTWISELRRTARKALDGGEKLKRYRGKFPSVEHLFPFWMGQNSSSAPDKKKRR